MKPRQKRNGLVGDDNPLAYQTRADAPDKREVSLRWLVGSALTGVTSIGLMGAALFVALDGKQILATPPELASVDDIASAQEDDSSAKSGRLISFNTVRAPAATDRRRMSVSTITRVGDTDVVRTKPFEHLSIALAADNRTNQSYPRFDPLSIFAEGDTEVTAPVTSSIIYGANVETEASIRVTDFIYNESFADDQFVLSDAETEEIVRSTAAILTDGTIEVASLAYVDPVRFGVGDPTLDVLGLPTTARIVPQNITVASKDDSESRSIRFDEMALDASEGQPIDDLLSSTGHAGSTEMASALKQLLNTEVFKGSHIVRLGVQNMNGQPFIVRASVYNRGEHELTIAINDRNQYVAASEPVDTGVMGEQPEISEPQIALLPERDRPSAYDAIYRGVLSYELDKDMAAQIVRMVAADVDFQSQVGRDDSLELFYSVPEEGDTESDRSLLFVSASFGGQTREFYRFTDSEGVTDYYDSEGRSARQFLLRNPVPSGRFRSGFGMRRHPILNYRRMHWGVDWSAPRGTPIIAPGNGVVTKTGWAGGYGRQLIVQHPNGYETMYAHLAGFGPGIQVGSRVRQGQVIALVGNTGLSTGPHLHYELSVNGERVDPMRVRLPKGNTLDGADLEAFKAERDRIDALVNEDAAAQQIAQVEG